MRGRDSGCYLQRFEEPLRRLIPIAIVSFSPRDTRLWRSTRRWPLKGWISNRRDGSVLRRTAAASRCIRNIRSRESISLPAPWGRGSAWQWARRWPARLQGSGRQVYCLISDAECNEGSTWEAVMFAAQHRLGQSARDRRLEPAAGPGSHAGGYRHTQSRGTLARFWLAGLGSRWPLGTAVSRCPDPLRMPRRRTLLWRTRSSAAESLIWRTVLL